MTTSIVPDYKPVLEGFSSRALCRWGRKMVFTLLSRIKYGHLVIDDGVKQYHFGSKSTESLSAVIHVHHGNFYTFAAFGGSIGAAEAYMAGYWSASDLTNVVRIIVRNQDTFDAMEKGWAKLMAPFHLFFHFFRKNTLKGSRENIIAHYDLGNEFYKLFLDETMTYSCGIFENRDSSLHQASTAKYDRICRKLQLTNRDHVLEIGSGWGGFAIYAAKNYGCRITTTTISDQQFDLAKKRIEQEGLSGRVEIMKQDYRNIKGEFDKLVSIEMIEAVGHAYLKSFFQICSRSLKNDGMMLLQAITIADWAYDKHVRSVDFIKRYIFPGGNIPSVTAISSAVSETTNLRLFHMEDITPHYAKTLSAWRENFFQKIEEVRALGFPDTFIRMWEYYFCYCEGGFLERYIGDVHMLFTKPECRRDPILPQISS